MIKKSFIYIIFILFFVSNLNAKSFNKKATVTPIYTQKGDAKYWSCVSGYFIKDFYKISFSAKLLNGTARQYCSMFGLISDMQEYGLNQTSIKVIDAKTQKLIDAKSAFYVVGSKVRDSISKVSKIAFSLKKDALAFMKKYKGKIVSYNTALQMAKDSFKSDKIYLKKQKQKRFYPMGKKIFDKKCNQNIDLTNYIEINELKASLKYKKLCKPLKEKQLHSVALYLWDVKRVGSVDNVKDNVKVKNNEKCPVCGMFLYKYPRWVAQIFYKKDSHQFHLSFDGVKDLMKFYFNPTKWGKYPNAKRKNIVKILVTDYYSQKATDGIKAFYVIKSNVYGPMGNELIPFEHKSDAKIFMSDHNGKEIIEFKNIKEKLVYQLDLHE